MIKNRREFLFIYDVTFANPNGDPANENRPRIDEETGINYVTPDRLKRVIRDQLMDFGEEIFVKQVRENDMVLTRKHILSKYERFVLDSMLNDNGKKILQEDQVQKKILEEVRKYFKGESDIFSDFGRSKLEELREKAQEGLEEEVLEKLFKEKFRDLVVRKILDECIDIRLFGITFAVDTEDRDEDEDESSSSEESLSGISSKRIFKVNYHSLTGPVQFKFGKSLHRVSLEYVKGTTVLASKKGRIQGTITERWVLPYSLIVFYGIANEKASLSTGLKDDDIDKMLKAMWIGFKANTDVISTSKMGHNPRLLIEIIYKENTLTHIGDLDNLISIKTNKKDEEIRKICEVEIDMSKLADKVNDYKDKIEKVRYAIDSSVKLSDTIENVFAGVSVERVNFDK